MICTGTRPQTTPTQQDDWLESRIFIPVSERGRSLKALVVSVRLSHIFEYAKLRLLGDLHGKTYLELGRYRNCSRKTLRELRDLIREIQLGNSEYPPVREGHSRDPSIVSVSETARGLLLNELPISARLENVLRTHGYTTVGNLHGCDLRELFKAQNCGRKTIFELKQLLRRAEAGEFTADSSSSSTDALTTVIRLIDASMSSVNERDREIMKQRLFGRNGESKTLEEVGDRFGITRERIRQIVKGAFEKVKRSGGPILVRSLETLGNEHNVAVVPISAPLVAERLSTTPDENMWPASFYVYAVDQIAPFIPTWSSQIGHESVEESHLNEINSALEEWLRAKGEHPTAKEAFDHLRADSTFSRLSAAAFFSALRRARRIILDFPRPDEPRLRLRRLRLFDVALPVLADSSGPLTPENIIERARSRFGNNAVMLSGRTTENALAAHPDIFRLGPRSFGLRQHFVSSEADRPPWQEQFIQLLRKQNRPISTIEVCDKRSITLPAGVNSYELAEILREDKRLIDLGRRLFGLTKWGVEEREHIKDLLPKILSQADRPLTGTEIYERLTKFRSATPTGLSNILRDHPKIARLEFEHYGLRSWGNSRNEFFVGKRSIVERAVRRIDPPITFAELCKVFTISLEGAASDALWKSCSGSQKLRRAPDRRDDDTLLMHKAVSLEQALASIARTLARPAHAYELEWELRAKFGQLFGKVRLQQIEDRLAKSQRFLRNSDGAFFLDADLDLAEFDVGAIRAAAAKLMREEREILSSDDLLDRLELSGFDLEGMTRGILASVLRGSEEIEEVGRERFRAQ
jgi:DNA-binding CsgD family transcriptional regulator